MKPIIHTLSTLSLTALIFVVVFSCKKEESALPPSVETASADNIHNTTARVGGMVSDDGGAEVTERGVFWDTVSHPEKAGNKITIGSGLGTFYDTLTGLTSGTKYFVKAYAINKTETAYGKETFFTTQISLPKVNTLPVTGVTPTTARIGGEVTNNGGFEITDRGVFWGSQANPRLTGNKIQLGTGTGTFSHEINGLNRTIMYYYVAYATNIKGTSYGEEISFLTEPELPGVTTIPAIGITTTTASVGGNITSTGGAQINEKGIYWGTSPNPVATGTKTAITNGSANFADTLENLAPGNVYYYMAYAINSVGTAFGQEESFTTLGKAPKADIIGLKDLDTTSATIVGTITTNYLSTAVSLEYGTTTAYGSVVALGEAVTQSTDTVWLEITGLQPNQTYHARMVAVNDMGTVFSRDTTFMTVITGITGTVSDADGNTYNTIGIGHQQWMAENLRTTKYNDNADIFLADTDSLWSYFNGPAYCWYNNNDTVEEAKVYGVLYNWQAVQTGKLCPTGWHIPDMEDIDSLLNYIGGHGNAGALKEKGTAHWNNPNSGATNDFGFSAIGGGKRMENGTFDYQKVEGNYWSSFEYSTLTASYLQLLFNQEVAFQAYGYKKYGMSVRCVKD
jgi:uncharacterized protein (TIGR02145 family)